MSKDKVIDYMQKPTEGEFVSEADTRAIAIHRIVIGSHHRLLVTYDKQIVGIRRSTDLFNTLYDMMADFLSPSIKKLSRILSIEWIPKGPRS